MAGLLDHQLGLVAESTWGTPVTVTRFHELLAGSGMSWDPRVVQGQGLRVGGKFLRTARRAGIYGQGSGSVKAELLSKGFGVLLNACFGTSTHTLVSGSTYQQVFTATQTGTVLPALTVQEGIVRNDAAGTVDPYTYAGCSVTSFELDIPVGDIATLTVNLDAKSLSTATALATASYPTGPSLYHWGLGAGTRGGTLTAPTTTALGSVSGGTVTSTIKSLNVAIDNNLDVGRWVFGGRNQPTVGLRSGKVKAGVEYNSATERDALIGQTSDGLLLDLVTTEALSTGFARMQVIIPEMKINNPDALPVPTNGETVVTDVEWEILDNLTASPIYLVTRTGDTAI